MMLDEIVLGRGEADIVPLAFAEIPLVLVDRPHEVIPLDRKVPRKVLAAHVAHDIRTGSLRQPNSHFSICKTKATCLFDSA
jgi:hypothetical protein